MKAKPHVFVQYHVVRNHMQGAIVNAGSQYSRDELSMMDFKQVQDLYALHRPAILRMERQKAEAVLAGLERELF